MVVHSAEYRWLSYQANAQGDFLTLLTPHPLYTSLATGNNYRQAAYRDLFRYQLEPGLVDEIRAATNGNYALGSPQFLA